MTGIDTHAHVFARGLTLAEGRRYAPDYDAPVEDYLRRLDENGLSHGVLVQPSFLGTDNGFMLDALRRHPDRLRGIEAAEVVHHHVHPGVQQGFDQAEKVARLAVQLDLPAEPRCPA